MEDRDTRLKRLKMRSWRRGMKEMDLILGGYADTHLLSLSDDQVDGYEELIAEPDQTLYEWVSGKEPAPVKFQAALTLIANHLKTMQ